MSHDNLKKKGIFYLKSFYEKESTDDVWNWIFEICTRLVLAVCRFLEIHRKAGRTFGTSTNKVTIAHAVKRYYMLQAKNA